MAEVEGDRKSDPWLNCKHCGNRWEYQPVTDVPHNVWVAHIEQQKCPDCGTAYELTSARSMDRWEPQWRPRTYGNKPDGA